MNSLFDIEVDIADNLIAMLDALAARLRKGETDEAEYSRTLNYLRFKIGEELFERYASPLAKRAALRIYCDDEGKMIS